MLKATIRELSYLLGEEETLSGNRPCRGNKNGSGRFAAAAGFLDFPYESYDKYGSDYISIKGTKLA